MQPMPRCFSCFLTLLQLLSSSCCSSVFGRQQECGGGSCGNDSAKRDNSEFAKSVKIDRASMQPTPRCSSCFFAFILVVRVWQKTTVQVGVMAITMYQEIIMNMQGSDQVSMQPMPDVLQLLLRLYLVASRWAENNSAGGSYGNDYVPRDTMNMQGTDRVSMQPMPDVLQLLLRPHLVVSCWAERQSRWELWQCLRTKRYNEYARKGSSIDATNARIAASSPSPRCFVLGRMTEQG